MKISFTEKGNLIIEINKYELDENYKISKGFVIQNELFNEKIEENKFKFLRKKTIDFYKEMKEVYKNNEFNPNDTKFQKLRKKHFIIDLDKSFKKLINNNLIEVKYKTFPSGIRRIQTLKIN